MRLILLAVLLSLQTAFAAGDALTREVMQKGLLARLSVKVRDQDGNLVPDADVLMSFSFMNRRESNTVKGKTDQNGIFSGEALLNNKIAIHVNKEGYYETFFYHSIWSAGKDAYKTGRWEPWDPTDEVVLWEKKRPQRNYRRGRETAYHLTKEGLYGFDLLANKVVEPDSKDGHADFYFSGTGSYYDRDMKIKGDWEKRDVFTFNFPEDGFVTMKRNKDSDFAFAYEAPLAGYGNPVEFFMSKAAPEKENPYPRSEDFLIFRVSRKNAETGCVESYYGIIEMLEYVKDWNDGEPSFAIRYRINREPDDRNIEY